MRKQSKAADTEIIKYFQTYKLYDRTASKKKNTNYNKILGSKIFWSKKERTTTAIGYNELQIDLFSSRQIECRSSQLLHCYLVSWCE